MVFNSRARNKQIEKISCVREQQNTLYYSKRVLIIINFTQLVYSTSRVTKTFHADFVRNSRLATPLYIVPAIYICLPAGSARIVRLNANANIKAHVTDSVLLQFNGWRTGRAVGRTPSARAEET